MAASTLRPRCVYCHNPMGPRQHCPRCLVLSRTERYGAYPDAEDLIELRLAGLTFKEIAQLWQRSPACINQKVQQWLKRCALDMHQPPNALSDGEHRDDRLFEIIGVDTRPKLTAAQRAAVAAAATKHTGHKESHGQEH
jgi:hypothetical protein